MDYFDRPDNYCSNYFEYMDSCEKIFIQSKLIDHSYNVSATAKEIGLVRSHLYVKMKKYKIERPYNGRTEKY